MAPVATNISNGRSGSKTVRLMERERVATLSGSAAFTVQHTMQINPALPAFLPRLSTMAQLYEKYRVKSIRVMYHNLCGTNTAGNVLMAFDPDVLDNAPSDAVSFSQSTRYIDGAPWRMLTLNIPGSNQSFFTRTGTAPTGSDLKTYDYGQVHIATEAMADATTVGYIEIAYDIEFLERQPAPASGGNYSFRPQVYAGVPDPSVPLVFTHKLGGNGSSYGQKLNVIFDGVLPLTPLVDDIGIETFNGALVVPPGTYSFSSSLPDAGANNDVGKGGQGDYLGSAELLEFAAAHGITPVDYATMHSIKRLQRSYKWVDSAGNAIDAVGIADITGVSLMYTLELELENKEIAYKNYANSWLANGTPIAGDGSFTTTLQTQPQGRGVWPTAVITRLAQ
jgi:hypothetical protein